MHTFALEKLEEVKDGKLIFYKIRIDGVCLYDEFCRELENDKTSTKSMNKIRTYMNILAESDCLLPSTKFNSIKPNNKVIGYEFKSDTLRVYVIKKKPNVFIVLGGYKKNQKKDIEKFAKITSQLENYYFTNTIPL
jgi:hypothetical protein